MAAHTGVSDLLLRHQPTENPSGFVCVSVPDWHKLTVRRPNIISSNREVMKAFSQSPSDSIKCCWAWVSGSRRSGLTAAGVWITKEMSNLSTSWTGDFPGTAENTAVSVCVWTVHVYLLQVSSASSEPSGHSGSPSHRQRPGTHWPFKQANSAGAHVFLAGQWNREKKKGFERLWVFSSSQTARLQPIFLTVTGRANILKWFIMEATLAPGREPFGTSHLQQQRDSFGHDTSFGWAGIFLKLHLLPTIEVQHQHHWDLRSSVGNTAVWILFLDEDSFRGGWRWN